MKAFILKSKCKKGMNVMKTITRIFTLLMAVLLMFNASAYASSYSDISAGDLGSSYEEAINVLSAMGVFMGDSEGTFRPNDYISRAEAVAIVNRISGLSRAVEATGYIPYYTDVKADDWFAGDVTVATQMNIVAGDGDGTFRPNDYVLYEEMIKMLIAALQYTDNFVGKIGGFPTGYLVLASNLGVTSGVSETTGNFATRKVVAKLTYQTLTAPMFSMISYSSDGSGIYAEDESKILLEQKLKIRKLEGYVSANHITSLTSASTNCNDGEVALTITAVKDGEDVADMRVGDTVILKAGNTDIADYLGSSVTVYISYDEDDEYSVNSYVFAAKKANKVTIEDSREISDVTENYPTVVGRTSGMYISVYNEDTDSTNTEYNLDNSAVFVVNGRFYGYAKDVNTSTRIPGLTGGDIGYIYAPNQGSVTLLDRNGDHKYDVINVTAYETFVVDEVYSNNLKIATKNGGTITLNNKNNYSYRIKYNNSEIESSQLREWDVLSVARSLDNKSVDMIVSREKISSSIDSMYSANSIYDSEYYINGSLYKVASMADYTTSNMDRVEAGTYGDIYIDIFGNIAYFDITSRSSSSKYGFISGIEQVTRMGKQIHNIQLLTANGSTVVYEIASRVTVTDYSVSSVATTKTAAEVFALVNSLNGNSSVWTYTSDDALGTNTARYGNRVVRYTVDSQGKLSGLAVANSNTNSNYGDYLSVTTGVGVEYNKANLTVGNYGVSKNTIVFMLPIKAGTTEDDFTIASANALSDRATYNVAYISPDKYYDVEVLVITNSAITVGDSSNLAVVKRAQTAVDEDGYAVARVTFLQNGNLYTYDTSSDSGMTANDFNAGDVFEYALDSKGKIDKVAFGTADDYVLTANNIPAAYRAGLITTNISSSNYGSQYVFGVVSNKDSATRIIQLSTVYDQPSTSRHRIPQNANITIVDLTKTPGSDKRVNNGVFAEIMVTKVINGAIDSDLDYTALIKYSRDEITDVVIFKGYNSVVMGGSIGNVFNWQYQARYVTALSAFTAAETVYNEKLTAFNAAQQEYDDALTDKNNAQQTLDTLLANENQQQQEEQQREQALTDARTAVTEAETALTNAQTALTQYETDLANAETAYNDALAAYTAAANEENEKKTAFENKQTEYAAKQDVTADKLEDKRQAEEALAALAAEATPEETDAATQAVADATEAYNTAFAEENAVKTEMDEAEIAFNTAKDTALERKSTMETAFGDFTELTNSRETRENAVSTAQTNLATAREVLSALEAQSEQANSSQPAQTEESAEVIAARTALSSAEAVLTEKKQALENARGEKDTANNALNQAKTELEEIERYL